MKHHDDHYLVRTHILSKSMNDYHQRICNSLDICCYFREQLTLGKESAKIIEVSFCSRRMKTIILFLGYALFSANISIKLNFMPKYTQRKQILIKRFFKISKRNIEIINAKTSVLNIISKKQTIKACKISCKTHYNKVLIKCLKMKLNASNFIY